MKLDKIGFYTLSDARASTACHLSRLWRCELILSARCNFHCPYCRHVGGPDMSYNDAARIVQSWCTDGLLHIRFSGGEPTLHPDLGRLCRLAHSHGVHRVAISTNGSASLGLYDKLLSASVDDFSVSLDACCQSTGDMMAGGVKGAFDKTCETIRWLSARTYVTAGIVLTDNNMGEAAATIKLAHELGVADIRVIPAAQVSDKLKMIVVDESILAQHPILRYRIGNIQCGRSVRGLHLTDSNRCGLCLDDMAVAENKHYPCIIYMREGGSPIGRVGPQIRQERLEWYRRHNSFADPICKSNCLDVCVDYNNRFAELGGF